MPPTPRRASRARRRLRHQAVEPGRGRRAQGPDPAPLARLDRRGRCRWPDRLLRPPGHGGARHVRGRRVLPPVPPRRPDDGLTVPLQLQMLSSEHLPLGKCETLPNGNEIIFGIELDRIGRRVAYHFHRTHPGDVRQRGAGELVRVPADQVCTCSTRSPRGRSAACPGWRRRWSGSGCSTSTTTPSSTGRRSRRCSRASSPGPGPTTSWARTAPRRIRTAQR